MTAPLDPREFATAKLNLVFGAALDPKLPKLAFRIVGLFVGRHMKADRGGDAWPAVKTLCGELGVSSERAVREALYALLERGHLVAERKAGETTRYRIADRYFDGAPQPARSAPPQAQDEPGLGDTQAKYEPPPQAKGEPTISGNITPGIKLREMNSGKGLSLRFAEERDRPPTIEEKKPARRNVKSRSSPARKQALDGWESFWAAFPRKVGKAAAQRAYGKALESAGPAELLAGAERYAAERAQEPDAAKRDKFTAHAATWLNAGRWTDEPAPPSSPFAAPQAQTRREKPSIFEMAFAGRLPE